MTNRSQKLAHCLHRNYLYIILQNTNTHKANENFNYAICAQICCIVNVILNINICMMYYTWVKCQLSHTIHSIRIMITIMQRSYVSQEILTSFAIIETGNRTNHIACRCGFDGGGDQGGASTSLVGPGWLSHINCLQYIVDLEPTGQGFFHLWKEQGISRRRTDVTVCYVSNVCIVGMSAGCMDHTMMTLTLMLWEQGCAGRVVSVQNVP